VPTKTATAAEPSPPRPRGRPRLQDAERQALAATEALLELGPIRDITMEQVAQRAGVSKITLYRRWPSKIALLADVLLLRMATAISLDEALPPAAAIADHVRGMVREFGGSTGVLARGVLGECLADPAMATVLRDRWLAQRREIAVRIIARGLADGSFAARGAAEVLHDMLYGTLWFRFLFGIGRLDARAALGVMETVLAPAADWRRRRASAVGAG
jgi:AcrR family transcriptional regulator